MTPSVSRNPAASSKSFPGVRMVTASAEPSRRISSGSSTVTASNSTRLAPSSIRSTRRLAVTPATARTYPAMDDWLSRYSAALELDLTEDEVEAILDLARDVAHATERRFAPLSAYLAGEIVTRRGARGAPPHAPGHETHKGVGRTPAQ